jgi:hypothetical protein
MLKRKRWSLEGGMFVIIGLVFLCQWANLCFHVFEEWKLLESHLRTNVSLFAACSMLLILVLLSQRCRLSTLAISYSLFYFASELILQILVSPAFLTVK